MAEAIKKCVHCGFCLPACPTYLILGEEMDSPRGRILLMKDALEGKLPIAETLAPTDRCLGCLACVSACPSGVAYGELIGPFRAHANTKRVRGIFERLRRLALLTLLPYPWRFRALLSLARFLRPLARFLPPGLAAPLRLLPQRLPRTLPLPAHAPTERRPRARVALLAGCAQQVLRPGINQATLEVLLRNEVEVVVPPQQGCCGALAMHTGDYTLARRQAQRNLDAFPEEVDAIITNAAGCGSGMKEYPLLFRDTPMQDRAVRFAEKVRDISDFLDDLGIQPPPPLNRPLKLAYQDACHLRHAQGVVQPPRRLLSAVEGLDLIELPEQGICCGSAGIYNLNQPEIASALGERKAQLVLESGAEALASGNIGCITQLETHLAALGRPLPVLHTVEVLAMAYRRETLQRLTTR